MKTTTDTRTSRHGEYTVRIERLTEHRSRVTFEGHRDAVMVAVGRSLENTTQMYEFMFQVESVVVLDRARMRVECLRNTYAGD